MAGAINPEYNIDVFSERLRELAVKAGITPWPHNAIRHSFGSYFLGKTKDENRTASEMGNSPDVIIKHYRALVRDADEVQYLGHRAGKCLRRQLYQAAKRPTRHPR